MSAYALVGGVVVFAGILLLGPSRSGSSRLPVTTTAAASPAKDLTAAPNLSVLLVPAGAPRRGTAGNEPALARERATSTTAPAPRTATTTVPGSGPGTPTTNATTPTPAAVLPAEDQALPSCRDVAVPHAKVRCRTTTAVLTIRQLNDRVSIGGGTDVTALAIGQPSREVGGTRTFSVRLRLRNRTGSAQPLRAGQAYLFAHGSRVPATRYEPAVTTPLAPGEERTVQAGFILTRGFIQHVADDDGYLDLGVSPFVSNTRGLRRVGVVRLRMVVAGVTAAAPLP